ncbi:hypothetical protein [Streptomyces sp. NPDC051677]|uniref:hypothetical protein n=1 Tax=Streptomyces sp. NPDC051677 TaxID=3365669 RepID=UPI0037CF8596
MAHRNRSLSRGVALGMAAAAVALLTSCTPNSDTAHSSPPMTAQTPSSPAAASEAAGGSTSAPTGGPAVGSAGGPAGGSAGHTTAGSPAKTGGCRSLPASPTVKAGVTAAYRSQAQPPLSHIAPVKGTFYYGSCDGIRYAGTRFQLTPGSTEAEQVALQDEGAAMKYFVDRPGTGWSYAASDGFPADPQGCAAITQIPARLAALWNDCRSTTAQP